MPAQSSVTDTAPAIVQATVQATVVYEHSDIRCTSRPTESEALAWLAEALYLVEDGIIAADAPTPSLRFMDDYARSNGWTITLTAQPR